MGWFIRYAKSSVGAKTIVGVTGLILVGYLVAHLAGNLGIFLGQKAFNDYAAFLQGNKVFLWSFRAFMLAAFLIHAIWSVRLAALNRKARSQRYQKRDYIETKLYARFMALSGVVIFAFLVYHLLHFTVGVVQPEYFHLTENGRHDAYSMFVLGFQHPAVSLSYVAAMLVLAPHLLHGVPSFFQSLGLTSDRWRKLTGRLGMFVAIFVVGGNILLPLSVLGGLLRPVQSAVTGDTSEQAQLVTPPPAAVHFVANEQSEQ